MNEIKEVICELVHGDFTIFVRGQGVDNSIQLHRFSFDMKVCEVVASVDACLGIHLCWCLIDEGFAALGPECC